MLGLHRLVELAREEAETQEMAAVELEPAVHDQKLQRILRQMLAGIGLHTHHGSRKAASHRSRSLLQAASVVIIFLGLCLAVSDQVEVEGVAVCCRIAGRTLLLERRCDAVERVENYGIEWEEEVESGSFEEEQRCVSGRESVANIRW